MMKITLDLRSAALQYFVKAIGGTLLGLATLVAAIAVPSPAFADSSSCGGGGIGMPDPSSVYCLELGYELEVVTSENGGQHLQCVFPDGSSCDSWSFLQGECGAQFSYCAKQGYDQITKTDGKNPYSPHYAVCVEPRTTSAAAKSETAREIGSVTQLMGFERRYNRGVLPDALPEKPEQPPLLPQLKTADALPLAFDWRDHDGQDWMTAVKAQSACGSCWAFSAVGVTEAVYNIATNFPDLDLDLSEEFLVSDCPVYAVYPSSCCGGWNDVALEIIKTEGIPDETCMPYVVGYYNTGDCDCFGNPDGCPPECSGLPGVCSHLTCGARCGDWATRLVAIDSYTKIPEDRDQIKQAVVEKGPLSVCLSTRGAWDGAGVFRCTSCWDKNHNGTCETSGVCGAGGTCTSGLVGNDCTVDADCDEDRNDDGICTQVDCGTNHCVVIAGYDEADGAWIVKNSYGDTWGPEGNGYWNVGYGECNIEKYVYSVNPADINFPPVADANGPYTAECAGATTSVALDGTGSSDPNDDPLTYAWTTSCSGGSFDDDISATPTLTVNPSTGGCPIECSVTLTVTDDEGSSDSAASSVTIIDTTPPALMLPANTTVECDASTDPSDTGTATATDSCNEPTQITYDDSEEGNACSKVIHRIWRAADSCGNSISATQDITVVDTTAPDITPPADIMIACDVDPVPSNTGTATATDNCNETEVTYSDVETGDACYREITRTWTAVDSCGNSNSAVQQITVVDTTPPDIACNAPATITPADVPVSFTATATDSCDENPMTEITEYNCYFYTKKGKEISKSDSCMVNVDGDTISVLDSGGVGDIIQWTTQAVDQCGNQKERTCTLEVIKKGKL